MTADTHVHFISPQTAWLQGRAEGLNVINLLASQWGDLYTNVGDITGGVSAVSRDETLIYVGTENRQHLLGHMSLLGVKGEPVFPMTTAGPDESYLGDPTWNTLAEWSDEARRKDGLVVIPHFPNPYAEVAADIVLQKIDAVELNMGNWPLQLHEWYRYLNCGYRDGRGRRRRQDERRHAGGCDPDVCPARRRSAVYLRRMDGGGRGADVHHHGATGAATNRKGKLPGDEIRVPDGGATLHVMAKAESVVPFHALEIVVNGQVVALREFEQGTYACELVEPIHVPGSAWIGARCRSTMQRWIGSPRLVAAHTSPVYVVAGTDELFSPSDATYMLTLIEGGLTWVNTLSIPASPERHARNRKVFEDARTHLHERLHRAERTAAGASGASHSHSNAGTGHVH